MANEDGEVVVSDVRKALGLIAVLVIELAILAEFLKRAEKLFESNPLSAFGFGFFYVILTALTVWWAWEPIKSVLRSSS